MTERVGIERAPVELPVLPGIDERLWLALIELTHAHEHTWTLIGGQMVLLHALENGAPPSRVSTDLDVVVNARIASGAVRQFAAELEVRGFESAGISPEGIAHRYVRNGVRIDVLAPEGLGQRADLTTTSPGRTLAVPGGTQALRRTETVPVGFRGQTGRVPRPSLLGAIICKACAVEVDDVPDAQRADLALLLSLVKDPLAMAAEFQGKDRQRLRRRAGMSDRAHHSWGTLDPDAAARGIAAYRILTRRHAGTRTHAALLSGLDQ